MGGELSPAMTTIYSMDALSSNAAPVIRLFITRVASVENCPEGLEHGAESHYQRLAANIKAYTRESDVQDVKV